MPSWYHTELERRHLMYCVLVCLPSIAQLVHSNAKLADRQVLMQVGSQLLHCGKCAHKVAVAGFSCNEYFQELANSMRL